MKHPDRRLSDEGNPVSRETPPSREAWSALERWLGLSLDRGQRQQLERFHAWLADEAIRAGGIGPGELDRLYDRHVFDGLAYARALPPDARTIIDIGAGVGLPGIPVAVAHPDRSVILVDRSERRCRLARRAVRMLGLTNVDVRAADHRHVEGPFDAVLFRASLPLEDATTAFVGLASTGAVGLFGLSRLTEPPGVPAPPAGIAFEISDEAGEVLDSPFWLLRMRSI